MVLNIQRILFFSIPQKKLLESEWVSSAYGYPPINLETPEVLVRQKAKIPPEMKADIKEVQAFLYQSDFGLFRIGAISTSLTKLEEPDHEGSVDFFIKNLERKGAKNIITKEEEFTTVSGVKGVKIYGSGKFSVPDSDELVRGKYTILLFGGKGFQQQITLTWLDGDTYAEEIVRQDLGKQLKLKRKYNV